MKAPNNIVDFPVTPQHADEEVLHNGDAYYRALIADIKNAKTSINFETYIFDPDHIGEQIITALMQAAMRGVIIRVLVDGAGTPHWSSTYADHLEEAGVHTRIFHPFPWQIWNWSRSVVRIPRVMKWLYLMFKANSRNHRKICLIDNKIAYVGSMNVTKNHLPRSLGGNGWRDVTVRITNTDLTHLKQAFERTWHHRTLKERLRETFRYVVKNPYFRLNDNRHRRRALHKNLLRIMSRCRNRIWITNAYFIPDARLLKSLKTAAALGVDVRILLPRKSNVFFMTWAQACFYRSLLKAGVRIYEYKPSMLHAKTLILDEWMSVGSSNLNHRSLLHDLEIDVNIRSNGAKSELIKAFLQDLNHSNELLLDEWSKRPLKKRLMGRIALYLKYWI